MQLWNSNILKLLVFLIAGIVFGFYIDIPRKVILIGLPSLLLFLGSLYAYTTRSGSHINHYFGITAFFLTFCIGMFAISMEKPQYKPHHYTNYIQGEDNIVLVPLKQLKPGIYHYRYEAKVKKVNGHKASGRVLLYIARDSTADQPATDNEYLARGTLDEIPPPRNPHQFNYGSYLQKRHIYHQISLNTEDLFLIPRTGHNVYAYAASLREKVYTSLKSYGFHGDTLAVVHALLLGQRQDISEDIYQDYAAAGAIHILAVSGLHVGTILLLLTFLLKPLERMKYGKSLKFALIVLALWGFAFIAGLSASVVRAVCMFSFVALALQFRRAANIYNVLLVSMFFILLIKPGFLFDAGFQLSYAAVFAIVWLQPVFYNCWKPKWKAIVPLWKLTTVSIAAQLGVLPLSLYYFHQFPGLFFISNLVIVPLLGIILGMGILVIVLALLHALPPFLAEGYGFTIATMNRFVSWIARQESFIFRDIPFDWKLLLSFYLALVFLFLLLQKMTFRRASAFLVAVLCLEASFAYNRYKTSVTDHFAIFHKSRETQVVRKRGDALTVYSDAKHNITNDRTLQNYAVSERIRNINAEGLNNLYDINGRVLLYIDSLGIYRVNGLKTDYILLGGSPKVNLDRVLRLHQPKVVIADGSNYRYLTQRWKATCKQKKFLFHNTYEKGAFILNKN